MDFFKTLIVDDSASIRWLLKYILDLQFPSMVIREASEGEEALRIIEDLHPNLIFMDIVLPGQNGIELTKAIKCKYPNTTVVIFSSCFSTDDIEMAYRNGANYYLLKGTKSNAEITSLVENVLTSFGYNKCGFKIE